MSLFEFMTWAEVARGNDLLEKQNGVLEEMQYEQQLESSRQKVQQREKSLIVEFEKLYKSGGDIDVIQMHQIIEIKNIITNEYNRSTRTYYRHGGFYKPNYKNQIMGIIISLSIAGYLTPSLLPFSLITWCMFGIAVFFLFGGVKQMINDIKLTKANTKRQKEYEEDVEKAARLLKVQFPELTPYGVYLKWYLDQRILKIADALVPLYPEHNQHKMIKKFYLLFELHTSAFRHYDDKFIRHMDGYFVKHFRSDYKKSS